MRVRQGGLSEGAVGPNGSGHGMQVAHLGLTSFQLPAQELFLGGPQAGNHHRVGVVVEVGVADGHGEGASQRFRPVELDPDHELPVLAAVGRPDTLLEERAGDGTQLTAVGLAGGPGVPVLDRPASAIEVVVRPVERLQHPPVPAHQVQLGHLERDDVGQLELVAVRVLFRQSTRFRQPRQERRSGQRDQRPDHGEVDRGRLHELDHDVEAVHRVRVEAHDESPVDHQPVAADGADRLHQVDPGVLVLLDLPERLGGRGLNAHEDREEPRGHHVVHQLRHLGQPEVRFRVEPERVPTLGLPDLQRGHERGDQLPVADEVVVHHEHVPAEAGLVEGLQLVQDLLGRLVPRLAPVHDDDVAELAALGTAAGHLDGHAVVGRHLEQVEPGDGGAGQAGLGRGLVAGLERGVLHVRRERGQEVRIFQLTQHEAGGELELRRFGEAGHERPAHHHGLVQPVAAFHHLLDAGAVDDHSTDEDHIRVADVVVRQFLDVLVHQAELPVLGHERGHRHQGERRHDRPRPGVADGRVERPVGVRRARLDQKNVDEKGHWVLTSGRREEMFG